MKKLVTILFCSTLFLFCSNLKAQVYNSEFKIVDEYVKIEELHLTISEELEQKNYFERMYRLLRIGCSNPYLLRDRFYLGALKKTTFAL